MHTPLRRAAAGALALLLGGCAARQAAKPPMTQAQANQQLRTIATDPQMPDTARAAAQQGVDEGDAQRMMEQGK